MSKNFLIQNSKIPISKPNSFIKLIFLNCYLMITLVNSK